MITETTIRIKPNALRLMGGHDATQWANVQDCFPNGRAVLVDFGDGEPCLYTQWGDAWAYDIQPHQYEVIQ